MTTVRILTDTVPDKLRQLIEAHGGTITHIGAEARQACADENDDTIEPDGGAARQ